MEIIKPNLMTHRPKEQLIGYIDMDGVIADFDSAIKTIRGKEFDRTQWDPPEMFRRGFYKNLPLIPGAKEGVKELLSLKQIDWYIGSKPSTKSTTSFNPFKMFSNYCCSSEKYDWIGRHFPELIKKIVLTCDKGLLAGDYLIDDDRRWIDAFQGTYILFDYKKSQESWEQIVKYFKENYK